MNNRRILFLLLCMLGSLPFAAQVLARAGGGGGYHGGGGGGGGGFHGGGGGGGGGGGDLFNLIFWLLFVHPQIGFPILIVVVVLVKSDHLFDTLAVRIAARASDFNVSLRDGSAISGSDDSGPFAEIWSFLRRRGTQTLDKAGLIEGNCPNCGAAIEMNQNANC